GWGRSLGPGRWGGIGSDRASAAVLAAQGEAVGREGLLDLFDRLLAEVRDRRELVLAFNDEVADRLDPDALEAVVRAYAELELLDREVLHPVRERRLGSPAAVRCGRGPPEAPDPVETGANRERAAPAPGGPCR